MLLNHTTAIVRVYIPVRTSNYCPEHVIPGTIGGAVPISTSGNRNTSGWPLYITSNNKLPRHSRKTAYEERDEAPSVYISYMVYMIITQTRCTVELFLSFLRWFRRKDAAVLLLPAHGLGKKSRACAERKIRSNLMECIHAGVMRLSIE